MRTRLLFVCSRNQWRSPTAEQIYMGSDAVEVRSRGLSSSARRVLRRGDLLWAEVVFVMEAEHKRRLVGEYREEARGFSIHVLDIPDEYGFVDPELIELIEGGVSAILDSSGG